MPPDPPRRSMLHMLSVHLTTPASNYKNIFVPLWMVRASGFSPYPVFISIFN